ncbi:MAG: ribonuclease R [Candidatus Cloacimonetes bacterium]|nr:ribonuclease R [Candidatus Cloacimonadota bacterium]MBL7086112.1 ribonuclease R [Candidatus Cloacimonadota bacterium]
MLKKGLSTIILNFLYKNKNKEFTPAKLSKIFCIKKHNYTKFKKILYQLEKNGKIRRKGKKYYVKAIYKTMKGIFDASALTQNYSFAFVKTEKEDIKVFEENCLNAYHNDIVDVAIIKRNRRGAVGMIMKIVERKNQIVIGNAYKSEENLYVLPDNKMIDNDIKLVNADNRVIGKKVAVQITDWGERNKYILPIAELSEILGNAEDPNIDLIAVVKQYGLPEEFPQNALDVSSKLEEQIDVVEINKRKDFRNLTTFTIDPISAKDFDDAISLENLSFGFRLYIHIADVSHYVEVNSPIFQEAYERGTSIYLLQNTIPMLPTKICNNLCSLKSDKERLAISVIIDYDKNYNLINREVVQSIILSDARLNYQQVDKFFRGDEDNGIEIEIKENLLKMRPLANHLTKKRYARGSLDFDLPDSEFEFDENGYPINILRIKETESHLLIEEFMLVANQFIAELIAKKCNSGIFRIHEPPDPVKMGELALLVKSYNYNLNFAHKNQNLALKQLLDSIKDENHHRAFDNLLLRTLMKAEYSYKNLGHFGLALKSYTHFTSPIRRFPDLVVHHLLKQYVFGCSSHRFSLSDIKAFAVKSSEREIIALNAERTLGKLKKNRFMTYNIGKIFNALIVNFNNKNIFVELDKYPIEGYIPLSSIIDDYYQFNRQKYCVIGKSKHRKFFLCQKVQVRVKRVEHNIEFELFR